MWKKFYDSVWFPISVCVVGLGILVLSTLLCLKPENNSRQQIRKSCNETCKNVNSGTHGRILNIETGKNDGFYECRCLHKDFPVEIHNIIIEKQK